MHRLENMNIQAINFNTKRKAQTFSAIKNTQQQTRPALQEMIQEVQQALQAVPTIQNASLCILRNADKIVEKSDEVQQKAQEIMAQIIDSSAYQRYCVDSRNKRQAIASSYIGEIKLDKKVYDVKITSDKITVAEQLPARTGLGQLYMNETYSRDIYEFDTLDRELIYCAKGLKKQTQGTIIDEEYYFNDGRVSKVNLGVSKGEFDLTNQSFVFEDDFLVRFSSRIVETKGKTTTDRCFEFAPVGVLSRFSRGCCADDLDTIEKELEYSFSDGKLKTFRKDFVDSPSYWGAKLFAQFENENDFYVEVNSNSNDSIGYSGICFYQNGKIEGSVVE